MSEKVGAERTYWVCKAFTDSPPDTTVRGLATILGISKSNVFYHLKQEAPNVCPELVEDINLRLYDNKRRAQKQIAKNCRKYWRKVHEQRKVKEITRERNNDKES